MPDALPLFDAAPKPKRARRAAAPARPSDNTPYIDAPCRDCGRTVGAIAHPEFWDQPQDLCWRCWWVAKGWSKTSSRAAMIDAVEMKRPGAVLETPMPGLATPVVGADRHG